MKKLLVALALTLSVPASAQSVLKVNGQAIPISEQKALMTLLKTKGVSNAQLESTAQNILVKEKIIGQEAWRKKIAQDLLVQRQLSEFRAKLYQDHLIQLYLKSHPVTPQEEQRVYASLKEQYSPTELQVRHILVSSEKEAKDLLYLIEAGEDMGKLAQLHTLDKATAKDGGLIPFNNIKNFRIPNFAYTAKSLKKGQVLNRPFRSNEGYHIMKLEDIREVPFPELSAIEPEIRKRAEEIKANGYIAGLYRQAKVVGKNSPKPKSKKQ